MKGVENERGDSRAQETRPADADALKGAPESMHVHAFAKNGKPHNPKGETLHAPPGGQLAPGKSSQPEGCDPERRTTRRVRLLGHKIPLNPKGATKKTAKQEGENHHTPLRTAQPQARAAQPKGCVALSATWIGTSTRRSRTTRRVRHSTLPAMRPLRQTEPHNPKGATLTRRSVLRLREKEPAQPEGCDKMNRASTRVQTTTRRSASHSH